MTRPLAMGSFVDQLEDGPRGLVELDDVDEDRSAEHAITEVVAPWPVRLRFPVTGRPDLHGPLSTALRSDPWSSDRLRSIGALPPTEETGIMAIDERRRIALHRQATESWGEEAADTLLELGAPAGQEVATRSDLQQFEQRLERRFEGIDHRSGASDARIDHRFEALDHRLEAMEHRLSTMFERRISAAVTAQTRTLVFSQLGALVVIAALAFGLR